ncbi:hypothetical protein J4230_05695 [Candidatus Woesearchaeota archaeon]|nr:hypothetical protein [Candidatus Woesearchaeota archaeon]
MILGYETIISKIVDATEISRQDIESKIEQKLKDLQDLISREGAAHIIANELNVKLFDATNRSLKIAQIQPGLNSVNIISKVINVNEVRTFQKENRQGRIGSLLVGDETGTIRLVIWDEKLIDLLKEIKQEDILKINNAYSKQNNNFRELHLGSKSQIIINPENESIASVKLTNTSNRKQIKDLVASDFVEVFGTIVQVFEPKYYNSCSVCNKKTIQQGDLFNCPEHGSVPPKQTPILNIFFDDGTGNIRAVLFRDQAAKLILNKEGFEDIKKEVLGKQLILKGKVNNNEMFNRIELVVNNIEEPKPEDMIAEMQNDV